MPFTAGARSVAPLTIEPGGVQLAGNPGELRELLQAEFARNDARLREHSRWLHDDVAQVIVAAGLALADEHMPEPTRRDLQGELARLGAEVRARSRGLVAPALEHLDPVRALSVVTERLAAANGLETVVDAVAAEGAAPAPRVVLAIADVLDRFFAMSAGQPAEPVAVGIRAGDDSLIVRVELPVTGGDRRALPFAFAVERLRPFGVLEWFSGPDGGHVLIRASLKESPE